MKIKVFIYALCIFVITLLQSTILDYIKILHVKPNLLVIFIISVALLRGNVEGAVVGFFTGLAQDMAAGKSVGFYALLGMYTGVLVGSVNKRLYRENFLVILFFTFVSTLCYESVVYLVGPFAKTGVEYILVAKDLILPEAVYNSLVSIIIYIFAIKLSYRLEQSDGNTRKY